VSDGVVVDTNVLSWLFDQRPNPLRDRYRSLIDQRRVLVASQSVMELRYRALHAGWGKLRRPPKRRPEPVTLSVASSAASHF
jgi:predicted nucleic acid-binding protein